MIQEKIKITIQKIHQKIVANKILALFFLILIISGTGYLSLVKNDKEDKYFCVHKVYEEDKETIASKGDNDEWTITSKQAEWIRNNCPETIWTTKEKDKEVQKEKNDEKKDDVDELSYLQSCGDKNDWYTVSPLKQEDYYIQIPLGNLNPTGHVFPTDHIYLAIKNPEEASSGIKKPKPLYSPGDIWITNVSSVENVTKRANDYDMTYYSCRELSGKFGHIDSISQKIKNELKNDENCSEYTTGGDTFKRCEYKTKIQIPAGEEIGTAGGGRSSALDIWAYDTRIKKLEYANPDRWQKWRSNAFYVACPTDYFVEDLKNSFLKKFGNWNGKVRTKEPICGTVAVDVKGTAQGHWFLDSLGESQGEDPHMALAPSNTEPEKQAFSMGNSGEEKGFKSGTYFFVPKSTGFINRDFSHVKPDGQVYCYNTDTAPNENYGSSQKNAIYVTMPDANTVRVEKSTRTTCGTGPWTMKNFIEFVR